MQSSLSNVYLHLVGETNSPAVKLITNCDIQKDNFIPPGKLFQFSRLKF